MDSIYSMDSIDLADVNAMSTCQKHSKRKRREWIETIACYLCPSDAIKMPEKSQLHNQAEKNWGKKSKNLQELKTNSPLLCIIWRSIGILCGFSSRNILEALLFSHDSLRILLNPKSVRRFLRKNEISSRILDLYKSDNQSFRRREWRRLET